MFRNHKVQTQKDEKYLKALPKGALAFLNAYGELMSDNVSQIIILALVAMVVETAWLIFCGWILNWLFDFVEEAILLKYTPMIKTLPNIVIVMFFTMDSTTLSSESERIHAWAVCESGTPYHKNAKTLVDLRKIIWDALLDDGVFKLAHGVFSVLGIILWYFFPLGLISSDFIAAAMLSAVPLVGVIACPVHIGNIMGMLITCWTARVLHVTTENPFTSKQVRFYLEENILDMDIKMIDKSDPEIRALIGDGSWDESSNN